MACMCSTNGTPHLVPPHTAHTHTSVPLFWPLFWPSVTLPPLPACLPAWGRNKPLIFLSLLQHIKAFCKVTLSLSPSLSLSLSLDLMGSYLCSVCAHTNLATFCFFLDFCLVMDDIVSFFHSLVLGAAITPKKTFLGVCDEIGFPFFKFFLRFLSGWIGIHPWEDLAKFGYRSERTLELFWIPSFLRWHGGTCCLNMAISVSFSSKYVNFGSCVF